jgi:hypothetical protein
VKFNVEEINKDKEKLVTFEAKPIASPSTSQFNPPLRTQSFNQNHPAFPIPPPTQQDYLNTLRNVTKPPLNQPTNFVFPKTDVPPPNGKTVPPPMVPYPTHQNSQSLFNNSNNKIELREQRPNAAKHLQSCCPSTSPTSVPKRAVPRTKSRTT